MTRSRPIPDALRRLWSLTTTRCRLCSGAAALLLALAMTQLVPTARTAEAARAPARAGHAAQGTVHVFTHDARIQLAPEGTGAGCALRASGVWRCAPGVTVAATGAARIVIEPAPNPRGPDTTLRIHADQQAHVVVRTGQRRQRRAVVRATDDAFVSLGSVERLRGVVSGGALIDVYGTPAQVELDRRQLGWLRIL